MQNISQHISYLLLSCRKVTVPGLGAFSANFKSATFDPYDGVFCPSHIRLSFDSNDRLQTSDLAASLERKFNLDYKEASELVCEYAKKIQQRLQRNRYCRLEGLGYLLVNNQGEIILKDTFWKKRKN